MLSKSKVISYGSTQFAVPEWATEVMFDKIIDCVEDYDRDWELAAETVKEILWHVDRYQAVRTPPPRPRRDSSPPF